MGDNAVIWIIVGVVVLALLVVLAVALSRRQGRVQLERRQNEARELREKAAQDQIDVRHREAEAARVDAEARLAHADAEARAADAQAKEADARRRVEEVGEARAEAEADLRRADEIDPDVPEDGSTRDASTVDDGPPTNERPGSDAQRGRHEA